MPYPHRLTCTLASVLIAGLLLLVGCGDDLDNRETLDQLLGDALTHNEAQIRGPKAAQLLYARNSQVPYTGWVKSMWPNGQVRQITHFKDGKKDGPEASWLDTGQKQVEGHFKAGEPDGLFKVYDKNGSTVREIRYKDGREILVTTDQITARSELLAFSDALGEFAIVNHGRYPDYLEELATPDESGHTFLRHRTLPLDPWDRPYIYRTSDNGHQYQVSTLGADGRLGGTGADKDIVVTQDSSE